MTAVAGLDLDAETRTMMLTSASEESVRASAELAAIGALAACAAEQSGAEPYDLAAALHEAATTARLAGLEVDVPDDGPAVAAVRAECVRLALPALIRLVAGAGKHVRASAMVDENAVCVRIARVGDDADSEALPAVVDNLVDALGAVRGDSDDAVTIRFGATA